MLDNKAIEGNRSSGVQEVVRASTREEELMAAIHPAIAAKCTKRQVEVFEQIGEGVTNPPAALKTLEALHRKGLIASQWEIVGRDRFGEIKMPRWFVPIPVHIQWCSWCDENATEEECSYED